jgi:asparagine synthase (glutamine-hydrolysing)
MCGLAGILNLTSSAEPITAEELLVMTESMRHRGPDDGGLAILDSRVGLGLRRLAVIDLSEAAHQPFFTKDEQCAVVFNGEIYNYIEVRSELQARGHRFRTSSDTEVLLNAYLEWDTDCVTHFNGMWAFVIADRRKNRVFISRDRFGVKPLYYMVSAERMYLASEAKAILAVRPECRKPNLRALSALLRTSVSGEMLESAFEGIRRLEPGTSMLVSDGKVTPLRYWTYPMESKPYSYGDAVERTRELIEDSIRLRLRSDVPVGSLLSGGLDSATVVCFARRAGMERGDVFTAGFPGFQLDETEQARQLASELGLTFNGIASDDDRYLELLSRVVYHLEYPHASPPILPLFAVYEVARRTVTVMLDGQGADELFGGYWPELLQAVFWNQLHRGHPLRAVREVLALDQKEARRLAFLNVVRDVVPGMHRWYREYRGDESVYAGLPDEQLQAQPSLKPADPINARLMVQHQNTLVRLLSYGDAISMAHSVEARNPFMDYRLVEFLFECPGEYKIGKGIAKRLLRDATRGVVPDRTNRARVKIGFATNDAQLYRRRTADLIEPVLFSRRAMSRGLFDSRALRRCIVAHREGEVDLSSQIFRWLMTEIWFETFIDPPTFGPATLPDAVPVTVNSPGTEAFRFQ